MAATIVLEIPKQKTPEQTQGLLIKRVRENLGMTQKELGVAVGLSQMRISQIERGSGTSSVLIFRIARALRRSPESFEV
jgi:transcriptional regulator with XRE-family HTH domain